MTLAYQTTDRAYVSPGSAVDDDIDLARNGSAHPEEREDATR
jgi:hypothetical protein